MPEPTPNLLPRWPWWVGRHPLLALTAALVIWGLIDVRARGRIDPDNLVEHRTDFTVYTEAGAAFFDGRDPYAVTNARGWQYLYPPLFAILVAPLAALGPQWQVTIWFFISLVLLWGCYRETTLLLASFAWAILTPVRSPQVLVPRQTLIFGLGATGSASACPGINVIRSTGEASGTRTFGVAKALARSASEGNSSCVPRSRFGLVCQCAPPLPDWLPWAAAVGALLPTLNCLQRGQVGVLQLYLLLLGLRLLLTAGQSVAWRGALAGVVFALAVVIKVTPALPIGLLLLERLTAWRQGAKGARRQTLGCWLGLAAGLAIWLFLLPAATIGWQRNVDCLSRWCQLVPTKAVDIGHDLSTGDAYSVRNQSLVNAARHLGNWISAAFFGGPDSLQPPTADGPERLMDRASADHLLLGIRLSVVGLLAILAVVVGGRRDSLGSAAVFALSLVATLVVSPVARTHYFLLIAPAVLLVPWHLHRQGRTRLSWWLAWTPTVLVAPHYFIPLTAGTIGWLGIGITLWLIAAASALLLCGRGQPPVRVLFLKPRFDRAHRRQASSLPPHRSIRELS